MESTNLTIDEQRARITGELINLLETNNRVCSVCYMNFGKTYYVLKRFIEIFNTKNFLIVINSSIQDSYIRLFKDYNVEVTTYNQISKMNKDELYNKYKHIDYIVYDECHHLGAEIWGKHAEYLSSIKSNIKSIGFTATPNRLDGIDIINTFFNGVETTRIELIDGIDNGYVPNINYVIAYCDVTKLKEYNDDRMTDVDRYTIDNLVNIPEKLEKYIDKKDLNDVFKVYVFVPKLDDIPTAKQCCIEWFKSIYPNKNVNVYIQSSRESKKFNDNQLYLFQTDTNKSNIDIIISVNMINEATRTKNANTAILLRKTLSETVYFQQLGRPIVDDKEPLIFDLVDNEYNIKVVKSEIDKASNDSKSNLDRSKKMFFERINLIDETKDIQDILSKYRSIRLSREETKQIIIDNLDDIKYNLNIRKTPVIRIAKSYNLCTEIFVQILIDMGLYKKKQRAERIDYLKLEPEVRSRSKTHTLTEISKELGVSMATVTKCAEMFNIKLERINERIQLRRIREDYIMSNFGKLSESDMALNLGISKDSVNRIERDLRLRKKRVNNRLDKITDEIGNEIKELFLRGMKIKPISKKYGFDTKDVAEYLELEGLYKRLSQNERYAQNHKDALEKAEQAKKEIIRKRKSGCGKKDLCKIFHISWEILTESMNNWGVE